MKVYRGFSVAYSKIFKNQERKRKLINQNKEMKKEKKLKKFISKLSLFTC